MTNDDLRKRVANFRCTAALSELRRRHDPAVRGFLCRRFQLKADNPILGSVSNLVWRHVESHPQLCNAGGNFRSWVIGLARDRAADVLCIPAHKIHRRLDVVLRKTASRRNAAVLLEVLGESNRHGSKIA